MGDKKRITVGTGIWRENFVKCLYLRNEFISGSVDGTGISEEDCVKRGPAGGKPIAWSFIFAEWIWKNESGLYVSHGGQIIHKVLRCQ